MYQVHSLIEMIEMCKTTDNRNLMTENSSPRKFLSLKHLVNNKTTSVNWTEKLALKYKTIVESHKMIVKKTEEIMKNNQQQKIFMKKLQELSRRWEIVQQGNSLFAVIGKNTSEKTL